MAPAPQIHPPPRGAGGTVCMRLTHRCPVRSHVPGDFVEALAGNPVAVSRCRLPVRRLRPGSARSGVLPAQIRGVAPVKESQCSQGRTRHRVSRRRRGSRRHTGGDVVRSWRSRSDQSCFSRGRPSPSRVRSPPTGWEFARCSSRRFGLAPPTGMGPPAFTTHVHS